VHYQSVVQPLVEFDSSGVSLSVGVSTQTPEVMNLDEQLSNHIHKDSSVSVSRITPFPMSEFDFLIDKIATYERETGIEVFGNEVPTQILMNEYTSNMGIRNHFDDHLAFGETIVTISLLEPIWMNLTKPIRLENACQELDGECKVLLEAGSMLVMKGESRNTWRHGISKSRYVFVPNRDKIKDRILNEEHKTRDVNDKEVNEIDKVDGIIVNEEDIDSVRRLDGWRRVSLTIRKLLDGRKKCVVMYEPDASYK